MKKYDYLIVGAGLYGCTFAYMAKQKGYKCLVIDRRNHLGGNVFCEKVEGINVHKYGAHIFHTSSQKVWSFVNSIVPFNSYINSPLAIYKGKCFNLPFNMNTFNQMWGVVTPEQARAKISSQRRECMEKLKQQGADCPRNLEEQALSLIGKDIYETLIKGYTEKQWGRSCTELPAFIIKRLPVRFVYNNNYFSDRFQGIPIGGYNRLTEGLLSGIETMTDSDFFDDRQKWEDAAQSIVFTGRIDEFYERRFGSLEYRSLHFDTELMETPNYQGNAVVNYTEREIPFTRIIEHKHFEDFGDEIEKNPFTVVSKEYPQEWKEGENEPYYPVNDSRNSEIYRLYSNLAEKEKNVIFGGRLAEYKYYDMNHIIEKVLDYWS